MKLIHIYAIQNKKSLYHGRFSTFRACLEQAVAEGVLLKGANLRFKNLAGAGLDEARLPGADFTGANLTGANISEAHLQGANFSNAALYNACFAWSDLRGCDFADSGFGATDIAGADLSHAQFKGLSCFGLDFMHCRGMRGCVFENAEGQRVTMSRPPLVVYGLAHLPVVLADREILAGHSRIDTRALLGLVKARVTEHLPDRSSWQSMIESI